MIFAHFMLTAFFSLFALAGCGLLERDGSSGPDADPTPAWSRQVNVPSPVPANGQLPAGETEADLLAFLKGRAWEKWTPESGIRDSVRAHGPKIRTYLNETLAGSLTRGEQTHPVGSAAVKVLYDADERTVRGYALEMKTRANGGGDAWLWYEGFAPDFKGSYYGQGLTLCTGCHAGGRDFVTASAPKTR